MKQLTPFLLKRDASKRIQVNDSFTDKPCKESSEVACYR